MSAASRVPDLSGMSNGEAQRALAASGFAFRHQTQGGYREFRHEDGSRIWIRPNGEVVRLSPKITGQKQRSRYAPSGMITESHSTGEKIVRGD